MNKVYLATNGDNYEWSVEAIFATREEAERYVQLFALADEVEEWTLGIPDMPMEPDIKAWSCRYPYPDVFNEFPEKQQAIQCREGALSHGHIGLVDGHKGKNRGTSVYARTEEEAITKAREVIAKRDGHIYPDMVPANDQLA